MKRRPRLLLGSLALMLAAALLLALATWRARMPLPATLPPMATAAVPQVVAIDGSALSRSYRGRLNHTATLPLWQIPDLLRRAFVTSEDQRFWYHGGSDWRARLNALWSNLRAGHVIRGASTIGEQAARIVQPRPRTYWSHWTAGVDASRLLRRFGHTAVLEFYLNQVPYGARRRGIVAAARYYFGRGPAALDPAEQVALAVLVRSPRRYDPRHHPQTLRRAVNQLAARMLAAHAIDPIQAAAIRRAPIVPGHMPLPVEAGPFVVYARRQARRKGLHGAVLRTTLDPDLQNFVQDALRRRLAALTARGARNAAALVVDNASGAVRAWAVAPAGAAFDIDPVLAPRQPGSTLKPFIYGLAMQRLGWQPDHILIDAPLAETVRSGVHRYRNYSGRYYGRVSLRYALANSLNIPAVKTAQAVGVPAILAQLHRLGFSSLARGADDYGPAIVLGDGAVPLLQLVQGYTALARHGRFVPLHVLAGQPPAPAVAVLPPPVASVLASMLSDADARSAEFGTDSVLDLPYRTAIKTGTSSDYRDAWSVGFDDRYTVGVWIGRLQGGSTRRLTGASGPAPVLRQIFARLRNDAPYPGLWQSPHLKRVATCEWIGPAPCVQRMDWRLPHTQASATPHTTRHFAIARPLPGETLALDPRLPRARQRLVLSLDAVGVELHKVLWRIDGKVVAQTRGGDAMWTLVPGRHHLVASIWPRHAHTPVTTAAVNFEVLGGTPTTAP